MYIWTHEDDLYAESQCKVIKERAATNYILLLSLTRATARFRALQGANTKRAK